MNQGSLEYLWRACAIKKNKKNLKNHKKNHKKSNFSRHKKFKTMTFKAKRAQHNVN